MFDIFKMFKRSNVEILQRAIRKNMMVSFNHGEDVLHDRMFKQRSILMVDQEVTTHEKPEPGEPEEYHAEIKVEHNSTNGQSYVFFDKEYFEDMEEPEVDELIYQMFNQMEFDKSGQFNIDVPRLDGKTHEIPVEVMASEFTEEEEEEKKEIESSSDSCSSEAESAEAEKAAETMKKEAKKNTTIKVKDMEESEKLKNPRFKAGNAQFIAGKSGSDAQVFRGLSPKKPSDKDVKKIAEVQSILEHAIQGEEGGKSKSISPSKRLNMKAIITETSEQEYFVKKGEEGKDIKINLIVDRSGSMGGQPTKESNILISALNNLAFEYEELDVQVMYSETDTFFQYSLPVDGINSKEIWAFDRTGSAEGLSRTFNAHFDRMKEADINLVYTDGSIYDVAIDKAYMKAQEIELVGLYVNADFSPDEIMRHVEQNKQWFTQTIVRPDMKGLVNEMSNMIVMHKGQR